MGLLESLLKLSGHDWKVPAFSTISRLQKYLQVTISYRGKRDVRHLLVDSTGVKMLSEGELVAIASSNYANRDRAQHNT